MQMKTVLVILISTGLSGCTASRISQKSTVICAETGFLKVKFSDLIYNKSEYHGKLIETEGYFQFGFERLRIVYDTVPFSYAKNQDPILHYSHLWTEPGSSDLYKKLDSLNGKFVIVKGLYDTSRYGHNEAYFAEITNICEIKESTIKSH